MDPLIEVSFREVARDLSLESSIHHWVARLLAQQVDVLYAAMTIGRSGWRRTSAGLVLTLATGAELTAQVEHRDPYVAISEAFRTVRRHILEIPSRAPAGRCLGRAHA